ncbi:MAG: apolipoprotein N-acyltransferase [Fimbriimonadaceae bacterium]|nr:apolipoprotein N-acyltransferase [Fimbriimonadaceae bacterium]
MRRLIEKPWVDRSLPTIGSAILLILCFPPFNLRWLVLVALVPWFTVLARARGKDAARSGFAFGFVYFAFQMFWLFPFVYRWTSNFALALAPWLVTATIAGLFHLGLALLLRGCWSLRRPWLVPLVWAGFEGFRAYVIGLAFPWAMLAFPLWPFPAVIQGAAWGTVFLVSAMAAAVNLLIAESLYPTEFAVTHRARLAIAGFVVLLVVGSLVRYQSPNPGEDHVVMLYQPGIDQAFTPPDEEVVRLQEVAVRAREMILANPPELTVFPEGFALASQTDYAATPLGTSPPAPVLLGGNWLDADGKRYQTAYLWDGTRWDRANKTRLVVFGEYVPGRDKIPLLKNFKISEYDLTPGSTLRVLDTPVGKVGQMLCFEGLFPDLAARQSVMGAQAITIMSIDDWYDRTPAWDQLWGSGIFRSIESGLPLWRVGSRGRTFTTDSRGRITNWLENRNEDTLRFRANVPKGSDGFGYKFAFVWLCWAVMGYVGLMLLIQKPDRK